MFCRWCTAAGDTDAHRTLKGEVFQHVHLRPGHNTKRTEIAQVFRITIRDTADDTGCTGWNFQDGGIGIGRCAITWDGVAMGIGVREAEHGIQTRFQAVAEMVLEALCLVVDFIPA